MLEIFFKLASIFFGLDFLTVPLTSVVPASEQVSPSLFPIAFLHRFLVAVRLIKAFPG
jgi:hypothetical protein